MKQDNGMDKERNIACEILDVFEDFLESHNINIPNKERTEYAEGNLEGLAILFGSEYYELEDEITELIKKRG